MPLLIVIAAVIVVWLYLQGSSQAQGGAVTLGSQLGPPEKPGPNDVLASYNMPNTNLDSIAEAIGRFEGFGVQGSLPQRTNNPGDIGTFGGKVASYPDAQSGWNALADYIQSHAAAHPDWDFYDFFRYYLTGSATGTPGPGQDPDSYANFVASQVGVPPSTPINSLLGENG